MSLLSAEHFDASELNLPNRFGHLQVFGVEVANLIQTFVDTCQFAIPHSNLKSHVQG